MKPLENREGTSNQRQPWYCSRCSMGTRDSLVPYQPNHFDFEPLHKFLPFKGRLLSLFWITTYNLWTTVVDLSNSRLECDTLQLNLAMDWYWSCFQSIPSRQQINRIEVLRNRNQELLRLIDQPPQCTVTSQHSSAALRHRRRLESTRQVAMHGAARNCFSASNKDSNNNVDLIAAENHAGSNWPAEIDVGREVQAWYLKLLPGVSHS